MNNTIFFLNNNNILTYKITYNNTQNIIEELKNLGKEQIIEINYDKYYSDFTETLNKKKYDEYIGIVKQQNKNKQTDYFGRITSINVKIKKYPILYHIIFGKYKNNNPNIITSLKLYIQDEYGLINNANQLINKYNKDKQTIHNKPLIAEYDPDIPYSKKQELIKELLTNIELTLINIDNISNISHDIIAEANLNYENYLLLNQLINNKSKVLKK